MRAGTATARSASWTRSMPPRIAPVESLKWNMTPSPSHFTGRPPCAREVSCTTLAKSAATSAAASSPRSSTSAVPRKVEEGDGGRLPLRRRADPTLLQPALGEAREVFADAVLPVALLEYRNHPRDELGVRRGALVDELVLLLVREVEGCRPLPDGPVEELKAGRDEPLDAAAVETGEAREILVVGEIECRQHQRQHLRVLGAHPVILRRRHAELSGEPPHELGRAPETRRKLGIRRRRDFRLREEASERVGELARSYSSSDVCERDPGCLERAHQPHDVDVRRRMEALVRPLGDAEPDQPVDELA